MYLNFQANLVIAGAIFLCVLWIVAERKNWRLLWRGVIAVIAIIFISQVMVAFCQLRAATREHYFRTVLIVLSNEVSKGNTNLVCRMLGEYGHNNKVTNDMTEVVDLYRDLMQIKFKRSEYGKKRSDTEEE